MTRLTWGSVGSRYFEVGVDRGVLYVDDQGVPWSGLVSVDEDPSGGEPKAYYQDGVKYLNVSSREEFVATLEAFYSPREFDACDGMVSVNNGLFATQQPRKSFGLSYRTKLGNDVAGQDYAYKIHIIYNALAAPSSRSRSTISDSPEASVLSWNLTTQALPTPGAAATAHLIVDTSQCDEYVVSLLEDILYGSDAGQPRLPSPEEMVDLFQNYGPLEVIDNGDGTWTAIGNDDSVKMLDGSTFQIASSTADMVDEGSYTLSSL
jgi:hypothetical protein